MYGLVNQAIEDLAVELGGRELWTRIKDRSGIESAVFVDMDSYPDEVTYRLVTAASEVLDIPPSSVLEAFGRHWILYTGRTGYGELLETMGSTPAEFLGNLDAMHARVSLSMPALRPPSFVCEQLDATRLRLEYWSERDGLAPMVTGLLSGLGELLAVTLSVTHTLSKQEGADHDEFLVTHGPLGPATDPALAPPTS